MEDVIVSPAVLESLKQAGRVLILPHHNPDGDALGSATGLARALLAQGARAELYLTGAWSEHLSYLLEGLTIPSSQPDPLHYDLAALIDCHSFDRLGPDYLALATALTDLPQVVIDHHLLARPSDQAAPNWFHQPEASSTGELVWQVIKSLGWVPPRPARQALLLAMAADTGFFTQANTTPAVLRGVADLLELGGDLEEIHRRLKKNLPLRRLKLIGLALDTLQLHFNGRLATIMVTPALLAVAGAVMADTEDLVELGRSLAGVTMSALIKDNGHGPGSVRVSLRSQEPVDARSLALVFGGGGHRQASAYNDPQAAEAGAALTNLLARAEAFL